MLIFHEIKITSFVFCRWKSVTTFLEWHWCAKY